MPIISERGVTSVSRVISATTVNRYVLQDALIHVKKQTDLAHANLVGQEINVTHVMIYTMETCVSKHALNGARHVKMSPIVYRAMTDTYGYPVKYLVLMDAKETVAKKSMGRVYHADLGISENTVTHLAQSHVYLVYNTTYVPNANLGIRTYHNCVHVEQIFATIQQTAAHAQTPPFIQMMVNVACANLKIVFHVPIFLIQIIRGNYPNINGQCEACNSQCVNNECDSSSGKCMHGCTNGYWNQTCDILCDPECLSCSQANGSCTQCKNNTKNEPNCTLECSTTCNISVCGIDGTCTYGCITNTFRKKCVNRVGNVIIRLPNRKPGKILSSGRNKLSNKCKPSEKEHENLSTLYATVKKLKPSRAEYAYRETANLHSVIIIENPEYESQQTNSSCKSRNPVLTEDSLEIDKDDAFAKEIADIFVKSGGVYHNYAREVNKLYVSDLPNYAQNISLKDLEKEFQNIPHGLTKAFEVSQTKLNMHKNRYQGIYP
ncbi:hypothetical protein MAR_031356, partial [Mya arenaria]